MPSFLWSLLSFLIVIALLVTVHEYGHFWAARKCGIKVERFSIGFGKVIWRKVDKQGTEFAISVIPLGGYVKMLDSRTQDVAPQYLSQTFNHKSVLQRIFVILAGPVANLLFAILVYWVVFLIGIPAVKPVIDEVQPFSVAAQAGIKADSLIEKIDGANIEDWETVNLQLATKMGSNKVDIQLKQFDEGISYKTTLDLSNWHFEPSEQSALSALGIVPKRAKITNIIDNVADNSPAQKAGIKAGDKVIAINNVIMDWQQIVQFIRSNGLNPLHIQIERMGIKQALVVTPELNRDRQPYIGVRPSIEPLAQKYHSELKYDMLEALVKSVEKVYQLVWTTIKVIGKLFTGDLSLKNLSGPVSIAQGAGISSQIGLVYYLSFIGLISVNLGIMNLFPLPVLDGGHLVFLTIEGIIRKPVSDTIQALAYRVGAMLLLFLTLFALFNDIIRL